MDESAFLSWKLQPTEQYIQTALGPLEEYQSYPIFKFHPPHFPVIKDTPSDFKPLWITWGGGYVTKVLALLLYDMMNPLPLLDL